MATSVKRRTKLDMQIEDTYAVVRGLVHQYRSLSLRASATEASRRQTAGYADALETLLAIVGDLKAQIDAQADRDTTAPTQELLVGAGEAA